MCGLEEGITCGSHILWERSLMRLSHKKILGGPAYNGLANLALSPISLQIKYHQQPPENAAPSPKRFSEMPHLPPKYH